MRNIFLYQQVAAPTGAVAISSLSWLLPQTEMPPIVVPTLSEMSFIDTNTPLSDQSWNASQEFCHEQTPEILGEYSAPPFEQQIESVAWLVSPDQLVYAIQPIDESERVIPLPIEQSWNVFRELCPELPYEILGQISSVEISTPLTNLNWLVHREIVPEPFYPALDEFSFIESPTPSVDQSWNTIQEFLQELTPVILGEHSSSPLDRSVDSLAWNTSIEQLHYVIEPIDGQISSIETPTPHTDQSWNVFREIYPEPFYPALGEFSFVETPTPLTDQNWNTYQELLQVPFYPVLGEFTLQEQVVTKFWDVQPTEIVFPQVPDLSSTSEVFTVREDSLGWLQPQDFLPTINPVLGDISQSFVHTPLVSQSWNVHRELLPEIPFPVLGEISFLELDTTIVTPTPWNVPCNDIYVYPIPEILGQFSFIETPTLLTSQSWLQSQELLVLPTAALLGGQSDPLEQRVDSLGWLQSQELLTLPTNVVFDALISFFEEQSVSWLQLQNILPLEDQPVLEQTQIIYEERVDSLGWLQPQEVFAILVDEILDEFVVPEFGTPLVSLAWLVFQEINIVIDPPLPGVSMALRRFVPSGTYGVIIPEFPNKKIVPYGRIVVG